MAGLTLEDTEKALKMYFSGLLADDVPKPQHRDGRIVVWAPKSRRRLEHVTVEDVRESLTCIRKVSEKDYFLLLDRYKFKMGFEEMAEARLELKENIIRSLGQSLKFISEYIVSGGTKPDAASK